MTMYTPWHYKQKISSSGHASGYRSDSRMANYRSKIPSWHATEGLLYPRHLSLEQCSSEVTALYKASLVHGEGLVDLTGGFGIDCAFLATQFKTVTYIERQEELCELAMHNFPLLGLKHIRVQNGDGVEYLQQMPAVDCIFLDPARRNEHGGKQ